MKKANKKDMFTIERKGYSQKEVEDYILKEIEKNEIIHSEQRARIEELLEELIQIIQPKHIIVLGMKPFNALIVKSKVELKVEPNFKFSFHKGIPLAYIPNPSRRCRRRYYTGDKIRLWQNILVKFLGDEFRK